MAMTAVKNSRMNKTWIEQYGRKWVLVLEKEIFNLLSDSTTKEILITYSNKDNLMHAIKGE
jgi:hypothetical protein